MQKGLDRFQLDLATEINYFMMEGPGWMQSKSMDRFLYDSDLRHKELNPESH